MPLLNGSVRARVSPAEIDVTERLSTLVPPQNLEAEESVLGAMLLSPRPSAPSARYSGRRTSIARVTRRPTEPLSLSGRRASRSTRSPSSTSSTSVVSSRRSEGRRAWPSSRLVPSTSNVEHYARIVKEMSTLRGLVRAGHEITRLGQERQVRSRPRRSSGADRLRAQQRATSDFAHIEILLKESFERITQLYEAGAEITGIPAGFRELDLLTSGFQPGNLVILAARPSMGKSALGLHRRQPRRAPRDARRPVHARDVQVRGDPADDVQRGQGRVAAAAHAVPLPTTGRG